MKEIDLAVHAQLAPLCDFELSWQNNFPALLKTPLNFKVLGAFSEGHLVGYGIIEPATGDIPQLAVAKAERRKGIGTLLMHSLASYNKASIIRIANIDSRHTDITAFIEQGGIPKLISQHEMIRLL